MQKTRLIFGLALVLLALSLPSFGVNPFLITVLSQAAILAVFALSYNLLFGQAGMLSFGHAAYFGLGSFAAIYTINWGLEGGWPIPLEIVPLSGALAGALIAALFGLISVNRPGVPFAMISLGIGQLVVAIVWMFPGLFGGEEGISTDRVTGYTLSGLSYGPQSDVYMLIIFWLAVTCGAVLWLSQTPQGQLANAVRENPERVKYIGCNPTVIRYRQFVISGFFAGLSGGLFAISYEIVTADVLGLDVSAKVLFATYIGGASYLFGPVFGALIVTILSLILPKYTDAWLLYFGLFFVFLVIFSPRGFTGFLEETLHKARNLRNADFRITVLWQLAVVIPGIFGGILAIEYTYHQFSSLHQNTGMTFLIEYAPQSIAPLIHAMILIAVSIGVAIIRKWRFPELLGE